MDPLLRELADCRAITSLINAYARHMDLNEPLGVASLFTEDCEIDYGTMGGEIHGSAALGAFLTGVLSNVAATAHHCSNVEITFDGPDDARGVTYLYAWHEFPAEMNRPNFHLWAQYHDRYHRTPDGWRISARAIRVAGAEGESRAHVMIGRHPR